MKAAYRPTISALRSATALATILSVFSVAPAHADWAQSLGIGQKTSNIGSAGTATASDYDVFYANPAGAANFTSPLIGFGLKFLDTTNLDVTDGGGDHSVSDTIGTNSIAALPSVGAYMPVPGMSNVVVGAGFGAPFGLAGNFSNDGAAFSSFNSQEEAIIVAELTPTVGVKLSNTLNVGIAVGFTTLKHAKINVGGGTAGVPGVGGAPATLGIETDDDVTLPIPPWQFATDPNEISVTLGAQWQAVPGVALGIVYRTETDTTYRGDVNLAALGLNLRDRFRADLHIPAHLQVGATFDLTPQWKLMADARWTMWSDATGLGSPLDILFTGGAGTVGGVLGVTGVRINYDAHDTVSLHLGTTYDLMPNLQLQAGYVYDPSAMPDGSVDLISFSSDRHIFSGGATYTIANADGSAWALTVGGQLINYEDRTIALGESANAGGLGDILTQIAAAGGGLVEFEPNRSAIDIGGYIWSVGASVTYKFGGPAPAAPLK